MTLFQICAVLLTVTTLGGYLNHRYFRLPDTIGQMAFALVASLFAILLNFLGWFDASIIKAFIDHINFSNVLLHGLLSFLLFAGALHINLTDLRKVKWSVGLLSTVGVILATFIIGTIIWYISNLTQLSLTYSHALLFGALIAPTDPIAVLSMLKNSAVSKKMYVKIGAESLFNDGVGIVVFLTILETTVSGNVASVSSVFALFAREAFGGAVLGGLLGWITYHLLRSINDYKIEVLMTLSLVMGGASLAEALHVSAPICMVIAGLIIGNHAIKKGMEADTRKRLIIFWDLIDEIMNAVLFVLIGLKVMTLTVNIHHIVLGFLTILAVLFGRLISVGIPILLIRTKIKVEQGTIGLLTWGGLRGGLSIAMALSLPSSPEKSILVSITYIVVLFSILVQGLTFPWAIKIFTLNKKHQAL